MYPLKKWKDLPRGYKFKQKTSYSKHHLGLDVITPTGTKIYAPFTGEVKTLIGTQGGNTVWLYAHDKIFRFLHLSRFGKRGQVKEGDVIGYVGSTGSLSTGPHLHLDISRKQVILTDINNFLDPEKFDWKNEPTSTLNPQPSPNTATANPIQPSSISEATEAPKRQEIWQDALVELLVLFKKFLNLLK